MNIQNIQKYALLATLASVVLSLPFSDFRFGINTYTLSISTWLALLFTFTVTICLAKEFSKIFHWNRFSILLCITLIALLVGTIIAPTKHSFGIFFEWFFIPVLFSILLVQAINSQKLLYRHITSFLWILLSTIVISSLAFLLCGELTYDNRLSGLWLSPNHLGLFLTPLLLVLFPWRQKENHIILITLYLAGILTLLLTKSIAAICILLFFISYLCFLQRSKGHILSAKNKFYFIFIFVLIIISFFVLFPRYTDITANIERSSLVSRVVIWDVSAQILRTHTLQPTTDDFQEVYLAQQPYYRPFLEWAVPTPHNFFLMAWFTGGWLFLLTTTLLLSEILTRAYIRGREIQNYVTLIAICSVILHGLIDTPLFRSDLMFLFCLIIIPLYLRTKKQPV